MVFDKFKMDANMATHMGFILKIVSIYLVCVLTTYIIQ